MRPLVLLLLCGSITFSGAAPAQERPAPEAPRPLTARGRENLIAFTKLLGYVRFFHPSDQAAAADWDALAVAGVRAAEGAAGPAELARALEATFSPVAPTLRVFPTAAKTPAAAPELAPPGRPLAIVSWVHHGVAFNQPTMFKSERVVHKPGEAEKPDPAKPLRADLPGGVTALLPLALYQDDQDGGGTLPHAPLPAQEPKTKFSGDDRAVRLAAVALAWNVPQHFDPYLDGSHTDWPAALAPALSAAATDRNARAFLDTLRRMVANLRDGHGGVWHPSDDWSSRLPLLWDWIDGQVVVTQAVAEEAGGIVRGDVVETLDGRPIAAVLDERAELISGTTADWRRRTALFTLALGPKESEVRIGVRHPSGPSSDQTATVAVRRTRPSFGPGGVSEPRPETIAELRPGILYVDLTRIGEEEYKAALPRLAAARGLVFDLRGHPDGGLEPAPFFAHLTDRPLSWTQTFVPLATRPDRAGLRRERLTGSIEPAPPRLAAPAVFLADWRSVSVTENFLEYVQSYRLGKVVGSVTAGTTGNIAPFTVPGGYVVFWTCLEVRKHDGSPFYGVGIAPDVPAVPTLRGVIEGRDDVLERALRTLDPAAPAAPPGV